MRQRLSVSLATNDARADQERLALRLAIGAASKRITFSFPRYDADKGRQRVPSFYALEVVRAAEGELLGFDELTRRASTHGLGGHAARRDSVDRSEFDMSWLHELRAQGPRADAAAALLSGTSARVARAAAMRQRRWAAGTWTAADGLVLSPNDVARLSAHRLEERPYSPTTLQHYAACPYRFYLAALLRLAPREDVAAIEALDPLQRGRLIHEAQRGVLLKLKNQGALPLATAEVETAWRLLDEVLEPIAATYFEQLAPAVAQVWEEGVREIRADLRQWLVNLANDAKWTPLQFELGFGLKLSDALDPASAAEAVRLPGGLSVRGAIDLVEENGTQLRATDFKTGRTGFGWNSVIEGGTALQPVLYALVLETLHPDRTVVGGRLSYCTSRGNFEQREVPLDARARAAFELVTTTVGDAIDSGVLPAAPMDRACQYCDYRVVCGPHEEVRQRRKDELVALAKLREAP